MIITTTPSIEGRRIVDYRGIVFGEVVSGVDFVRDLAASFTNFFGGRSGGYEEELVTARQNALNEMAQRAASAGAAPVDSYVTPEPWAMPGYDSEVIMAAGAFVQGSSIELSADGPIKPPYAVYFQGGLTWQHAKLGILKSLQSLIDAGVIDRSKLQSL